MIRMSEVARNLINYLSDLLVSLSCVVWRGGCGFVIGPTILSKRLRWLYVQRLLHAVEYSCN
jgi:hypothetical protein